MDEKTRRDGGLLVLRVSTGLTMALAHGVPKLMNLIGDEPRFADPFGIGVVPSLVLAVFGELVCGLAIAAGAFTRWATLPFITTMLVAIFFVHGADPWSDKEHAFLFLMPAIAIALLGPGDWSVDRWRSK